jgi:hypothetical protein
MVQAVTTTDSLLVVLAMTPSTMVTAPLYMDQAIRAIVPKLKTP